MFLAMRVVVCSGCDAAIGQISELVDVDAVFAVGAEAFEGAGDLGGGGYAVLAERGDASDLRVVGVEDADGVAFGVGGLLLVEGEEGEQRGGEG